MLFPFLLIMNKGGTFVYVFCMNMSFPLGMYTGVELPGDMVTLGLTF